LRTACCRKIRNLDLYGYSERTLDRDKFDEFKTRFYELQGWDAATGYPTRATLESLGLGYVADELERNGKLDGGYNVMQV
jgi:aldehyde:ferredoxin oxidoreductase